MKINLKNNNITKRSIFLLSIIFTIVFSIGFSPVLATDVSQESNSISNTCFVPDNLGSITRVSVQNLNNEGYSLQDILNMQTSGIRVLDDQTNYQVWHNGQSTTTISITYLDKGYAIAGNVFGYYVKGHIETFVPIFASGDGVNHSYPSIAKASVGQTFTVIIPSGDIAFVVDSELPGGARSFWSTESSINSGNDIHVVTYNNPNQHNSYFFGVEDLPLVGSDYDYNDVAVKISLKDCEFPHPINTPPTITLTGSNPLTITQGTTFADPGATATDVQDGDLTSHIVVTGGPVNNSVIGTTTLIYTVTDSGGLSASTTRDVVVTRIQETKACDIVSDTSNIVGEGGHAVATYAGNPAWTAVIPGATWIWDTYYVTRPYDDQYAPFEKDFTISTATTATLTVAADNSYIFSINGNQIIDNQNEINYTDATQSTYTVPLQAGHNHIYFWVKNWGNVDSTAESNPAGLLYKLHIPNENPGCDNTVPSINTPPTITLTGSNPLTITQGTTFADPGATATDVQDGDLTSHIVVTGGPVNNSVIGTTTLIYTVTDSGGLSASTTRDVVVTNPNGGENNGNSLSVCLVIARYDNSIATSSYHLAPGVFSFILATTSNISSSTIQTPSWTTSTFTPNRTLIAQDKDAQCITYSNLPFGTYYYSPASTTGIAYQVSKYNDGAVTPINSIFDFFPYSSTTPDADGIVIFDSLHTNQTIALLEIATNTPPTITLVGSTPLSLTTGATFTDPGATAMDFEDGDLTSHIVVTGTVDMTTPTTYTLVYTVTDSAGLIASTTRQVVVSNPNGGGGGSSPDANLSITKVANTSTANVGDTVTYTITLVNNGPDGATNVSVVDSLPGGLTFVSATGTLGTFSTTTNSWTIGNLANGSSTTLTLVATINTGTEGQKITNTATASSTVRDSNTTNNTSGADITVNTPSTNTGGGCSSNCGGGGGNGPIVGSLPAPSNGPIVSTGGTVLGVTTENACNYLRDYIHIGWNNDPNEVKKLQVFLRDLEGHTNLQVTGVYDAQTVEAVNEFQVKYGSDILVPWDGTYNSSSFVYILTKKKVNEIYCKTAFPVSVQEQSIIDAYRNFINDLNANGVNINPSTGEGNGIGGDQGGESTSTATTTHEIGLGQQISNFFSSNLAIGGPQSSTTKLAIANFATAVFGFPLNWMKNLFNPSQCTPNTAKYFIALDILIVILLATLIYLVLRNKMRHKTLAEINKELDS